MTSIGSSNKSLDRYQRQGSPEWGPSRIKRILARISPQEFAMRAGVDVTTICRWKHGYTRPARYYAPILRQIEAELGCGE